jgi:uncharacterized repeat protein (TIGR03803 family)
VGLAAGPSIWAQTFTVLYEFTGHADGAFPFSGVIRDSAGNLYGTTSCGGSSDFGTVFKLDKNDKFSVLYNFPEPWISPGCFSGPFPGSLTLDADGNLYGAGGGGNGTCNGGPNCGVIFKVDPSGIETTIHAFLYGPKGFYPNLGLIRDAAGNLYGTTKGGGKRGAGTVFKLDSAGNETVLHTFQRAPDGAVPIAGLVQDAAGNFYGTTGSGGQKSCNGGSATCGVVFKVDPNGNETVFYSFTGGTDGEYPWGGLLIDSTGNLYGTAEGGNPAGGGYGVFFKVDPSGEETVLYNFAAYQEGFVTAMDSAGNFYGTSEIGGNPNDCKPASGHGCGVVFKLTP